MGHVGGWVHVIHQLKRRWNDDVLFLSFVLFRWILGLPVQRFSYGWEDRLEAHLQNYYCECLVEQLDDLWQPAYVLDLFLFLWWLLLLWVEISQSIPNVMIGLLHLWCFPDFMSVSIKADDLQSGGGAIESLWLATWNGGRVHLVGRRPRLINGFVPRYERVASSLFWLRLPQRMTVHERTPIKTTKVIPIESHCLSGYR